MIRQFENTLCVNVNIDTDIDTISFYKLGNHTKKIKETSNIFVFGFVTFI